MVERRASHSTSSQCRCRVYVDPYTYIRRRPFLACNGVTFTYRPTIGEGIFPLITFHRCTLLACHLFQENKKVNLPKYFLNMFGSYFSWKCHKHEGITAFIVQSNISCERGKIDVAKLEELWTHINHRLTSLVDKEHNAGDGCAEFSYILNE